MSSQFSSHGICDFSVSKNIITIDAKGPWNLEFFHQMHQDLWHIICNQVNRECYSIFLILRGDALATSDGLDFHLAQVSRGSAKAIAIDLTYCASPTMTKETFSKLYTAAKLKNKAFNNNEEEAYLWLKQQMLADH